MLSLIGLTRFNPGLVSILDPAHHSLPPQLNNIDRENWDTANLIQYPEVHLG